MSDNYVMWFFIILLAELTAEVIILGAKNLYPKIKKLLKKKRKQRAKKAKVLKLVPKEQENA